LKITSKDLSGDVRTIKRKQSDISQEEVVSKRKRVPSQNSVLNHQRAPSPQPTRPLNKDLSHMLSQTPAHHVQKSTSFAEIYNALGSQLSSGPGTSASNEAPSSLENQSLAEKDFVSQRSREPSTNFNP